jgi:tetratricopeptide (TPR) repeat protein
MVQLARQQPDSAYPLIRAALNQAVQQADRLAEATYRQQLGLLFYHQGSFVRAIDNLLRAQRIFRNLNQPDLLARNLNELGNTYYYNEQSKRALAQFEEALRLYKQTRNGAGLAMTYGNIGHIYEKRKDLARAYAFQKLALASYQSSNDRAGLATIYENIGSIFEDQERYDSAYFFYDKALTYKKLVRDKIGQIEVINNLGDVFRKTGRYRQGMILSRQAVQMARATGEKYQMSAALRDMAKTYRLLNQPDSAYDYLESSRDVVDDIYADRNNREIALLETLYNVEQKDSEIATLTTRQQRNTLLAVASVLVLLLGAVLGWVVVSRQRLRIRNERTLSQQRQQMLQTQNDLMQADLNNKQLQEENLNYQLALKSQQLNTYTLNLIQKNQTLTDLRADLQAIVDDDKRDQRKQLRAVTQKIEQSFSQDRTWDDFRATFDAVHPHFFSSLTQQFTDLSAADLRLLALLKMNMNSADTATLLGISSDSLRVARYRLRKKLQLAEGESLTGYVQRFG